MKKRFIIGLCCLLVFCLGPGIGKRCYRALTPDDRIAAWRAEFVQLDRTLPRTHGNEERRIEIYRMLAQRGIDIDPGIRDEGIEDHDNPYTLFVRICWQWEELLGVG